MKYIGPTTIDYTRPREFMKLVILSWCSNLHFPVRWKKMFKMMLLDEEQL